MDEEENIKIEDNIIATPNRVAIMKNNKILIVLLFVFLLLISFFYILFIYTPKRDKDLIIHISPKDSVVLISEKLEEQNIIKNKFTFKAILIIFSSDKNIISGDYFIGKNEKPIKVIYRIISGKHEVLKIKITLREGLTKKEMIKILSEKIKTFNEDEFLNNPKVKEGYLFPDTYFFYPMTTTDEIVDELTLNFNRKIKLLDNEIKKSGKSLSDIIIMASILEKEAKGKEDVLLISGILWKRLEIGMALQVDAAPVTYDMVGLPNEAISNPGFVSIKAAINPKNSPYLFYLHDDSGQVHFAVDFSEHRSNIARYLK